VHGVDEALLFVAHRAVHLHDALERCGDLLLRDRGADDLPERGGAAGGGAPEGDLVPLLAVLVDAEHADVADVVMAAGIHAAGHLQLDLAQVVEVVEIIKVRLDLSCDIEGAGVGERAEVQARAGDHVGEGADVRGRELEALQFLPHRVQLALRHVREQQVLVVRGAHQAKAHALGEAREGLHLRGGHVPGHRAVGLERDEHGAVAADFVGAGVVAVPGEEARLALLRELEVGEDLVRLWPKKAAHALDLFQRQQRGGGRIGLVFGVDQLAEVPDPE
jgi:hypothetical protein